jgi:hypothetical protein
MLSVIGWNLAWVGIGSLLLTAFAGLWLRLWYVEEAPVDVGSPVSREQKPGECPASSEEAS